MALSYLAIAAGPWAIRRFVTDRVSPRTSALTYLASILVTGMATGIMLALVLLKFLSSSLLAAMGDACGGIFEAGHGFLAASRWNYLLAVGIAATFILQMAFLLGGGARLLKVSHRLKKSASGKALVCGALAYISHVPGARRFLMVPDDKLEARTVGLLRPRILFHQGLVDSLSGRELAAVAAHEEAHRAGRDNLLVTVAKTISLTLFYLPGPRLALREMRSLLEKAADQRAAAMAGPVPVAEVLLKIARLSAPDHPAASLLATASVSGGAPGDISGRLAALISHKKPRKDRAGRLVFLAALTLIVLGVFASSALAVTTGDQREAFICFAEHTRESADSGVCELDHPVHAVP